ncbi:LLM class flavin-dependent oxidoreductase [Microbispora sp. NPDC046973]|uniref:LLM class flavin-dependent oxidoreductase n=1 Tax=Microbispora sp. NPDC046973 TaxID=3155022 RepID=UPI0033DE09C0
MTLHLAVALDGAGWHPAAWRAEGARPDRLFTPGYWTELVAEAERGLLDFVTFEDALGLQSTRLNEPDERLDQVRGRLDAVLIASRVAPLTSRIGLVPTAGTTHTEPFHVAIGIASLDHISRGRAGWRPQIYGRPDLVAHFGRRPPFPPQDYSPERDPVFGRHLQDLFAEAADAVEVVRRLWDSWEDDAEIRDVATGRFIDRDKLHYIDFRGEWFSVKGPSITPRSPQGQPLVTSLAHDRLPYEFAARASDVVYVTPRHREDATAIVESVRAAEAAVGRTEPPLRIFADLVVFLDAHDAAGRKARLDDLDGAELDSDAHVFTGTPEELAGLLLEWREAGLEGFRLRPGVLPHDLVAITRGLVPALQNAGAFRAAYDTADLRGRLGLARPASRYAKVS